jgi:hypothetical protein
MYRVEMVPATSPTQKNKKMAKIKNRFLFDLFEGGGSVGQCHAFFLEAFPSFFFFFFFLKFFYMVKFRSFLGYFGN